MASRIALIHCIAHRDADRHGYRERARPTTRRFVRSIRHDSLSQGGRRRAGQIFHVSSSGLDHWAISVGGVASCQQPKLKTYSGHSHCHGIRSFIRRVAYPVYTPKSISRARGSRRAQRTRVPKVFRTGRISRPHPVIGCDDQPQASVLKLPFFLFFFSPHARWNSRSYSPP